MLRFPQLIGEMRNIFLNALKERGITDLPHIQAEAEAWLAANKPGSEQDLLKEYTGALSDLYFAKHFNENEIEEYINLARKNDRFKNLYKVVNTEGATSLKIKKALNEFCAIPQGDIVISPTEAEGVRVALINFFISNQLPFISIAKNHITIRDADEMLAHTFWNRRRPGKIGGKAAGELLANKILLPRLAKRDPELEEYIQVPESYFFNSGIFSDFLDYNNMHHFHTQKYKSRDEIEEEYKTIAKQFEHAAFPPDVIEDMRVFLKQVGEYPLILRSSSLLEDNFGYAFSGKYDSIFLGNQGDLEIRLKQFVWGLKRVCMSTYGPSPILYRRAHNLLDFDERMSVLVQKVVGRQYGNYFFPFAAGVAFSYCSYCWTPRIRKEDGVVRLVLGLGTRAVDRVGNDYPRMIPLSHPDLRTEISADQIQKYSQKAMDVINLKSGQLETFSYMQLLKEIQHPDLFYALSIREGDHLAPPLFKTTDFEIDKTVITFDNFINKSVFIPLIKKVLTKLQEAYGRPVDVEFAWDGNKLYILQCRSLSIIQDQGQVTIPENIPQDQTLFTTHLVVANNVIHNLEYIVYVDPKAYAGLSKYEEKYDVGRVVSRLNRKLEGKLFALMGPGRWGSNDINLGVKVAYEDLNHTKVLGEIAFEEGGSTPEVSHGTHFFNDLIESHVTPIAIFPDKPESLFNEDFFLKSPNHLAELLPDYASYQNLIHVIHIPEAAHGKLLHIYLDSHEQKGIGFLGKPTEE
jgi:hypothetical protein